MKKFHLSAVFMLAVIFLVALMPTVLGFNVLGVGASVAVLVIAGFIAEPAPNGYVSPRMSPMRGEVGAHEIKEVVLKAMKERDEELSKQIQKSVDDISAHGKVLDETKTSIQQLTEKGIELTERLLAAEQKSVESERTKGQKELSPGEIFAKSDQLKEFVTKGGNGASQRMQLKAITSGALSGGSGIWSDRLAGVLDDPLRPLTVRDLLDQGTTSSNLIEWVREKVFTNNARPVTEGGTKPESNITYERIDVPVRTIAHWIPATKQVLADFPQLQTLINGRLTYGLKIKEEDQILMGDGTGENIHGLVPQATAYDDARNKTGDTKIDQIRHAILQVRQAFYPSTGIVMNPADWESIELLKDGEDRYLFANPNTLNVRTLWGLPVVESDAMPAGEFLVGSFRMAATLFDREQASIAMADQHANFFIQNMIAILAEERLALAVSRPKAFVHGDFV